MRNFEHREEDDVVVVVVVVVVDTERLRGVGVVRRLSRRP
jgi:hypothetical protein